MQISNKYKIFINEYCTYSLTDWYKLSINNPNVSELVFGENFYCTNEECKDGRFILLFANKIKILRLLSKLQCMENIYKYLLVFDSVKHLEISIYCTSIHTYLLRTKNIEHICLKFKPFNIRFKNTLHKCKSLKCIKHPASVEISHPSAEVQEEENETLHVHVL